MTFEAPPLDKRKASDIIAEVERALKTGDGWQGREGGAGWTLVQLFGRLGELLTNRLNRVADKHFLAFLDFAGLSLLPPQPAYTELTFVSAADGPPVIKVPARTQVATVPTETQPEVIFETEDELSVVFNEWASCIALDPVTYADRTDQVKNGGQDAFPVFRGQQERQRILYLRADELFSFTDEAARKAATVTLSFEFAIQGDPGADGWRLEWLFWDGKEWGVLTKVRDDTMGFSQDGDVQFTELPEMKETEVGGLLFSLGLDLQPDVNKDEFLERVAQELQNHGMTVSGRLALVVEKKGEAWRISDAHQTYAVSRSETSIDVHVAGEPGLWIVCRLTGGNARDYLPALMSIRGRRKIDINTDQTTSADAAFGAIQVNTTFIPIDLKNEFFLFGQRPAQRDVFYLMSKEAFSKPGAKVTITIGGLEGIPEGVDSSDLSSLAIAWEYYSTEGWTRMGVGRRAGDPTSERLSFKDTTSAFTVGRVGQAVPTVTFTVPSERPGESMFKETTVNGLSGYWIRASIMSGSYNVPARVEGKGILNAGGYTFYEAQTYAPLIKQWRLTYNGYSTTTKESPLTVCRSRVDTMLRDHVSALASGSRVAPFAAREPEPAFYMGFQRPFPPETTIGLLLDVQEQDEIPETYPIVFWEYWNGVKWTLLQFQDGSRNLSVRGFLYFTAPQDHRISTEFGRNAFWFRMRPHQQRPKAEAGSNQAVPVDAGTGKAIFTLSATESKAFERQEIVGYTWRLLSSSPPVAEAGADQKIVMPRDKMKVDVTLDASGSQADAEKGPRFIWRRVDGEEKGEELAPPVPELRTIRTNTVSALNAETFRDEVLGSSDGKPHQRFALARSPVHVDAQIAVREIDQPLKEELDVLEAELKQVDEKAQAILSPPGVGPAEGVWVRWHQVPDFADSTSASRHFTLDPINGRIYFGDGKRGKIPPAGRDNIKAALYRTHASAAGNVEARAITALRNPAGKLANLTSVTNPEPAVGGSSGETTNEIEQRGPQTLKHRNQAVTQGGYEWLARGAGSQVARVFVLPARNPRGLLEAGWVTIVTLPQDSIAQPSPNPALTRWVTTYLEGRALANLIRSDQQPLRRIHVKGPDYVCVSVEARIVPHQLQNADEVKLRVRERLERFLHPLQGGPAGQGWEPGRDVYLSEIHDQIESVPGVDHVKRVRLSGSLQQWRLELKYTRPSYLFGVAKDLVGELNTGPLPAALREQFRERGYVLSQEVLVKVETPGHMWTIVDLDRKYVLREENQALDVYLPFDIPTGSQVSTFDERLKLLLADPVFEVEELTSLAVYGFKVGNEAAIVGADNTPLIAKLEIADVSDQMITLAIPDDWPNDPDPTGWDALLSSDERLRLPLAPLTRKDIVPDAARRVTVKTESLREQDKVCLVAGSRRDPRLEFLLVETVERREDRIFVPEGHLVYSGTHDVAIAMI